MERERSLSYMLSPATARRVNQSQRGSVRAPHIRPSPPPRGSNEERVEFERLQNLLVKIYGENGDQFKDPVTPHCLVVNPSLSVSHEELELIEGVHHYEERMLCLLLLLRMPRLSIVYISSMPIHRTVIDYFLSLVPDLPQSHVRARFHAFHVGDDSRGVSLTEKMLKRPRFVRKLRSHLHRVKYGEQIHMSCFCVTDAEVSLAVRLGVPIYGCDPRLLHLGTKSGSRKIFRNAGVPLPPGFEDLKDSNAVVTSLVNLHRAHPELSRAMIKLNDSFAGEGNAIYNFSQRSRSTSTPEPRARNIDDSNNEEIDTQDKSRIGDGDDDGNANDGNLSYDDFNGILAKLENDPASFEPQAHGATWSFFRDKVDRGHGAIVEAFVGAGVDGITEKVIASPSVQIRICPDKTVEIISTHDQILDGLEYVGCTFPCDKRYRRRITYYGRMVGDEMAKRGVLGRFAVDFMVTEASNGDLHLHAIEINLRKGGTSHPFNAMHFLLRGHVTDEGEYETANGTKRCYRASDVIKDDIFKGLMPGDLIDLVVEADLIFDQSTGTGIIFHNISGLSQFGKVGMVCIAPTVPEAEVLYDQALETIVAFAKDATLL